MSSTSLSNPTIPEDLCHVVTEDLFLPTCGSRREKLGSSEREEKIGGVATAGSCCCLLLFFFEKEKERSNLCSLPVSILPLHEAYSRGTRSSSRFTTHTSAYPSPRFCSVPVSFPHPPGAMIFRQGRERGPASLQVTQRGAEEDEGKMAPAPPPIAIAMAATDERVAYWNRTLLLFILNVFQFQLPIFLSVITKQIIFLFPDLPSQIFNSQW